MAWPLVVGMVTCLVLFSNSLVRVYEQNIAAQARADDALLRELWTTLRVLENSPGGLMSTELKLAICHFLAASFRSLHARHGSGAGYLPCIEAADSQINTLQQRSANTALPSFEDEPRIKRGQQALPGVRRVIKQLLAHKAIPAADAKNYMRQIDQRSLQLAADKYVIYARRAEGNNNIEAALRYYKAAQRALGKAAADDTIRKRMGLLDSRIQTLRAS